MGRIITTREGHIAESIAKACQLQLDPATVALMQQIADLDAFIVEHKDRNQVQITVRILEGKPAREAWLSVR